MASDITIIFYIRNKIYQQKENKQDFIKNLNFYCKTLLRHCQERRKAPKQK